MTGHSVVTASAADAGGIPWALSAEARRRLRPGLTAVLDAWRDGEGRDARDAASQPATSADEAVVAAWLDQDVLPPSPVGVFESLIAARPLPPP